jgi:DNA-binding MarR family transcriptional regulator
MTRDSAGGRPPLSYLLRVLHQRFADEIDGRLRRLGFDDVRPGAAKVFPFVPPDGIQVGELAVRAGVRKQTMAEAVEQLERAGYVERRPNPADRRSRLVFLTERGRHLRPAAAAAGREVEARWGELVGDDKLDALREILVDLLARLDDPASGRRRGRPSS